MSASRPEVDNTVGKVAAEEVKNLIFGGGGAAGLAYAGVFWRLAQIPGFKFENLNYIAGTSIGAVAALGAALMPLGLTPEQMLEILASIDFGELKDSGPPWEVGKRILWDGHHYGYKGDLIYKHVLQLLQRITGRADPENITFKDLKKLGAVDFHITACKLIDSKPQPTIEKEVFSWETSPDTPVAKAIRASAAAYPYFDPVEIDGYYYVDGGYLANVPAGIYDYPRYFKKIDANAQEESQTPGKCPPEMEDFKNRRHCIRSNMPVDREHNPGSLTFSIVDSHSTKPLRSKNLLYTAPALINGMLTRDDNSLNPRVNNRIEIPRRVGITKFKLPNGLQNKIIWDGVDSVSTYFNHQPDSAYKDELYAKIDVIRKKANDQKKIPASEQAIWSHIWKRRSNEDKKKTAAQPEVNVSYKASL